MTDQAQQPNDSASAASPAVPEGSDTPVEVSDDSGRPAVAIVTDSSADLPAAVAAELGITVVPLTVNFGTEQFVDGVDLNHAEFWERCNASAELPGTSAANPAAFSAAYEEAAANGAREVVAITLSAELSATLAAAQTAAESAPVPTLVVDSRSVSMGAGTLVLMAARMAAGGASAEEIAAAVTSARDRTHLIAALDTFDNLRKGGRIGAARSLLGSALSVKPLITVTDGKVEPAGRQRTRSKARAHLVNVVAERADEVEELAVVHAACDDVDTFAAALAEKVAGDVPQTVAQIGPVVGTHSGIGAIGVIYRTRS